MVKTTLHIRPVQRQRISPYLERSIAVLTAPSTNLRDEIQLALDLNPFLELQEQPLIRESDYPSTSIETLMKEVSVFKDGNCPRVGWGMFSTPPSSGSSNAGEPLMGEGVAPLDSFHAAAQRQTLAQHIGKPATTPVHHIKSDPRKIYAHSQGNSWVSSIFFPTN